MAWEKYNRFSAEHVGCPAGNLPAQGIAGNFQTLLQET
jgi:hypothetical protein